MCRNQKPPLPKQATVTVTLYIDSYGGTSCSWSARKRRRGDDRGNKKGEKEQIQYIQLKMLNQS